MAPLHEMLEVIVLLVRSEYGGREEIHIAEIREETRSLDNAVVSLVLGEQGVRDALLVLSSIRICKAEHSTSGNCVQ